MLQEVGGLVEDLQALRALERAVVPRQALVLMWIGQVSEVMATHATFVGGFSSLDRWVLVVLQIGVWLEQDAVDCTTQGVLSRGRRD